MADAESRQQSQNGDPEGSPHRVTATPPLADPSSLQLHRILSEIQRRGGIGRVTIDDAIAHADLFVVALSTDVSGGRLVDIGSGGGLPGLAIVSRRPDLSVTLVERRHKRADLLRFGVRGLDAGDRVRVIASDVESLIRLEPGEFDVVTARSFGPLSEVIHIAAALLRPGGLLIVSEPPDGELRITPASVADAGMIDDGRVDGAAGAVHRWRRTSTTN